MPERYPPEFRRAVYARVVAGEKVTVLSKERGVSEATLHLWKRQTVDSRTGRVGGGVREARAGLATMRCLSSAAEVTPSRRTGASSGFRSDYVVSAKICPRTNSMMSPSLRLAPRRTAEANAAPPRRLRRSSASERIRSASVTRNGRA